MMTWLVYKSGSLLTDEILVVVERCVAYQKNKNDTGQQLTLVN